MRVMKWKRPLPAKNFCGLGKGLAARGAHGEERHGVNTREGQYIPLGIPKKWRVSRDLIALGEGACFA